jgi:hypothetical protein
MSSRVFLLFRISLSNFFSTSSQTLAASIFRLRWSAASSYPSTMHPHCGHFGIYIISVAGCGRSKSILQLTHPTVSLGAGFTSEMSEGDCISLMKAILTHYIISGLEPFAARLTDTILHIHLNVSRSYQNLLTKYIGSVRQ